MTYEFFFLEKAKISCRPLPGLLLGGYGWIYRRRKWAGREVDNAPPVLTLRLSGVIQGVPGGM